MNKRKKILYTANLSNIIVCFIMFITTLVCMLCMLFEVRFMVDPLDPLHLIFNLSLTTQKDILIFVASGIVVFISLIVSILLSAYTIKSYNTKKKSFTILNIINFIVTCFFIFAFFIIFYYNTHTLFLKIVSCVGMGIYSLIGIFEFISLCWKEAEPLKRTELATTPLKEIKPKQKENKK